MQSTHIVPVVSIMGGQRVWRRLESGHSSSTSNRFTHFFLSAAWTLPASRYTWVNLYSRTTASNLPCARAWSCRVFQRSSVQSAIVGYKWDHDKDFFYHASAASWLFLPATAAVCLWGLRQKGWWWCASFSPEFACCARSLGALPSRTSSSSHTSIFIPPNYIFWAGVTPSCFERIYST